MKTVSSTYKVLRALGSAKYEIRILQGNNTYGMDKLKSVTMSPILTDGDGISIGGANSTQCKVELLELSSNWPRMAQFTVQFRIASETNHSEWISAGTFYTDERSEDKYGNLSIIAFDKMLMMEQSWTDKIPSASLPASWPITAKAWATMIQNANLATFADLTQLDDTVAFVGLDTSTTIRDVLKSIAAVHAGNWTITTNETLTLVQFENITGNSGQGSRTTDLGLDVYDVEDSPALDAVTGVHLETEAGVVVEAGTDSGYVVKSMCDFSSTTGVAALCLSKINGYVYQPFSTSDAYLDPIAEIGDFVTINEVTYQIMSIEWDFSKMPMANVSAPYDREVDHEYTIVNQAAKNYRKTMASIDQKMGDYVPWDEVSTAIEQNAESVVIAASGTYVTQADYDEQIAIIQNQLDGNIQSWSGNYVPTLNNAPASSWTTSTDKAEHVGDLYFVNSDAQIPEAGNYYRFEENNGTYSWTLLNDSALTEALAAAAAAQASADAAQDTADASMTEAQLKGRIFVVQPTTPYDIGDLWFDSVNSDIKVCLTARASGSFNSNDWKKRDKYTDDSAFNTFYQTYNQTITAIQNQLDQKAETYYQDTDPMSQWGGVTIAGIAIAGIDKASFNGDAVAAHTGDLWYRTTDGTTWYFNGATWVQQDVPDEVFDKIDGKAQIFISQPYTPYAQGDLWFNSETSDIMTCITSRASGDYVASDWQKRNKYTDDTTANNVGRELTTFESSFSVEPSQIKAEVEKRVIKDKSETKNSFGWVLSDSSHTWYANNQEVMKVQQSGLTVKGNITATSGYIGGTTGFEITATAIRNGMTSLSDTSHNGIYLGTDGIALGKGNFKVTNAGALTARSGYIGNGTSGFTIGDNNIRNGMTSLTDTSHNGVYVGTNGIALGKGVFKVTSGGEITAASGSIGGFTLNSSSIYTNNQSSYGGTGNGIYIGSSGLRIGSKFKVDNEGNITAGNIIAETGTFKGNVYAKNIQYGTTGGYLNGGAVSAGTITGGSQYGQIAANTLGDYNVGKYTSGGNTYGAFTTGAFSSGVNGSLYNADKFGLAIQQNASDYPTYFTCGTLLAKSGITSNGNIMATNNTVQGKVVQGNTLQVYYGSSSTGGWNDIGNHTHDFEEKEDGTIAIKKADWSGAEHSFNIADTKKYKTDVLASRAVLYCNATNYSDFSENYDCDITGDNYHYKPSTGNVAYGRIDIRNSSGTSLKTLRIKYPAGSSAGQITINLKETSQSVNPYYGTLPYYAYINNNHYVQISAVSTGTANRSQYIDINDIVNYAYEQGGGGGGGGHDTPITLRCTNKSEGSGIAKTWTFQITSTTDYWFTAGNSYTFYY